MWDSGSSDFVLDFLTYVFTILSLEDFVRLAQRHTPPHTHNKWNLAYLLRTLMNDPKINLKFMLFYIFNFISLSFTGFVDIFTHIILQKIFLPVWTFKNFCRRYQNEPRITFRILMAPKSRHATHRLQNLVKKQSGTKCIFNPVLAPTAPYSMNIAHHLKNLSWVPRVIISIISNN